MSQAHATLPAELHCRRFNVFVPQPIRLSKPHKLWLIAQTWLKVSFRPRAACYGGA